MKSIGIKLTKEEIVQVAVDKLKRQARNFDYMYETHFPPQCHFDIIDESILVKIVIEEKEGVKEIGWT